jgi:hypothetical protein
MRIFSTLILILAATVGFGQDQKISFGIDFTPSVNWATTNIKDAGNDGISAGMSYGISVVTLKSQNWGISTAVRINHSGYKITYNFPFGFQTFDSLYLNIPSGSVVKYKMQQIELPVGFTFRSREIGYTTIAGEVGINPAYNLKTKVNITNVGVENETAKDEMAMFSAGYYFGGGILYSLGGSTAVKAMVVFSSGFTDLTKDKHQKEDQVHYYRVGLNLGIVF